MDSETLVSFSFRAPHHVRTVELLGSWDNFQRPYTMYHDKRRGRGFYSGCFQFENIIFDGSEVDWAKPRSGGLKQGGTYWYYFRLDDDMETYDDLRECTAACPLMPGQTVNIIHVPREVPESPLLRRSASVNLVGTLSQLSSLHTMNPRAKYEALNPPPVSKVHDRCISDFALNGRLEKQPPTPPKEESPSSSEEGLLKTGRRMFGSVGTLGRRGISFTGSLRNMASRAAMRAARLRQEETTYEASLIDERGERASIHPPPSMHNETSRPPTRRPTADISIPGTEFHGFSQATAISTLAASPIKQSHNPSSDDNNDNSDAASIGPRSIIDIQFLSPAAAASAAAAASEEEPLAPPRPRLYSLHNPDQLVSSTATSSQEEEEEEDPADTPPSLGHPSPSPSLAVASPTFSDATTISTLDGGSGTPSQRESLIAVSYVDISGDESIAAQQRWSHTLQTPDLSQQQSYRLPDGSEWLLCGKRSEFESGAAPAVVGEARERSVMGAIHSELGYLGDSIR